MDGQMSEVVSCGGLRELVRVREEVGLKDCKVLDGAELTSYGMEDLREYA